jgi:putative ubiquitin-RnfH superfamily antitoxin RatB of RatAB toxin-antitoxin module
VAYALPEQQRIIALQVEDNTTAMQAAEQSGIVKAFPGLALEESKMGIFGKAIANPAKHIMAEGERLEIYRPLIADPKESRKARAEKAKQRAAS